MKSTNIYMIGAAIILLFSACDELDQGLRTTLTADEITISYNRTKTHATGTYTSVPKGFLTIGGAMGAAASDEAEHTDELSNVHRFNVGSWNPYVNPDNMWASLYSGIRRANQYLVMADDIDWTNFEIHQTPERNAVYAARVAEIERTKYEVRFLRAYFYFELVKRYGGVPIITEALNLDTDISAINRKTLRECIDFIISECDITASKLPASYPNEDLGRVTKGAALALKSRILLYAASDLFNSPSWAAGYPKPELVSLAGGRTAQWQQAADAAKAVIELGVYSLATNYGNMFRTFNSPEIIFTRRDAATNTFEKANYPISYEGRSGSAPTQNLVDAYEMANGKPISDPTSGYDPQNPYFGRDPRLAMTIITNNNVYKGRPVECWIGGRDGAGIPMASRTGYYLKKYLDEGLDIITNKTSVHSWHIFRLAEIFLNYAEALNEVDPGHVDIKTYVDLVRNRVNMPPLPDGLSQQEMRERIRNERRVELAFEDHRFWDVRRWMTAPNALGVPVKRMEITRTAENTFVYEVKDLENRVFHPKMYFYPIPQSELNIAKSWVQNPLW
jgi:starch-binding outer membrane protein, SusD/RagB family